jgi:hypothetical protein
MTITVNGKEVDLSKALPLQLRDLRRLKRDFGFELGGLIGNDPEKQAGFFQTILQKANPEITPEDVDTLTLSQMHTISAAVGEASRVVDVPFSASSTN